MGGSGGPSPTPPAPFLKGLPPLPVGADGSKCGTMQGKSKEVRSSYIHADSMSKVMLTKMSSKGQIVIPKTVRDDLDIREGDVFAVFGRYDSVILKRIRVPSDEEFERVLAAGRKHAEEKGITPEDVDRAIHEYRKERRA